MMFENMKVTLMIDAKKIGLMQKLFIALSTSFALPRPVSSFKWTTNYFANASYHRVRSTQLSMILPKFVLKFLMEGRESHTLARIWKRILKINAPMNKILTKFIQVSFWNFKSCAGVNLQGEISVDDKTQILKFIAHVSTYIKHNFHTKFHSVILNWEGIESEREMVTHPTDSLNIAA